MSANSVFDSDSEMIVRSKLRPKDAATLILVRRDKDALRVLMGKRHAGMAFMAGKYVFPGGKVDPGDQRLSVGNELRPNVLEKLTIGTSPSRARGLALAAIRETFEETGVLLGDRGGVIPRTRTEPWKQFFRHGVVPRLDQLNFIGRAITPPNRTRRFDARFFMADASAIGHMLDQGESDELLEPCWVTLEEARAQDLAGITRRMLEEIEHRVGDGPDSDRPVPFFRMLHGKYGSTFL